MRLFVEGAASLIRFDERSDLVRAPDFGADSAQGGGYYWETVASRIAEWLTMSLPRARLGTMEGNACDIESGWPVAGLASSATAVTLAKFGAT